MGSICGAFLRNLSFGCQERSLGNFGGHCVVIILAAIVQSMAVGIFRIGEI